MYPLQRVHSQSQTCQKRSMVDSKHKDQYRPKQKALCKDVKERMY